MSDISGATQAPNEDPRSPLEQSIVEKALGPIPDPPRNDYEADQNATEGLGQSIPEQTDPLPATDIPLDAAPVDASPLPVEQPVQEATPESTPASFSGTAWPDDPQKVEDAQAAEDSAMTEVVDGVFVQQTVTGSLSSEDIEHRFGFHKATIEGPESSAQKHADLRYNFKQFASVLSVAIPGSREASLMWTALEEASMWAHKAIAQSDPIDTEA